MKVPVIFVYSSSGVTKKETDVDPKDLIRLLKVVSDAKQSKKK